MFVQDRKLSLIWAGMILVFLFGASVGFNLALYWRP